MARAARFLEPASVPVHQGQAGALRSECCRHRGTEIAGRAGHQHHLSRRLAHVHLLPVTASQTSRTAALAGARQPRRGSGW